VPYEAVEGSTAQAGAMYRQGNGYITQWSAPRAKPVVADTPGQVHSRFSLRFATNRIGLGREIRTRD